MTQAGASGVAHKFGDDINTDYIIAGKYTKTLDYDSLAAHLFEDIDPEFIAKVRPGDFIVAGSNFGCGSSREQAPIAIKHAGIAAVLAKSFARIFFRNAVNIGLPVIVCDTDRIAQGDRLRLSLQTNELTNLQTGEQIATEPLPVVMVDILQAGGLVPYLKQRGGFVARR